MLIFWVDFDAFLVHLDGIIVVVVVIVGVAEPVVGSSIISDDTQHFFESVYPLVYCFYA
jgi:hypothetical protein